MIDFHNHILPSVDDGSKTTNMSISMLKYARDQGITDVVNTVHFQHPKVEGMDISYDRIKNEINTLQDILKQNGINVKIHIGSEVFFLPNLLQLVDNPLATFGNGKYMLIEFHPHNIPDINKQVLFDLKMKGVTPIIAHPERYVQVQKNINIVSEWLEAGCIMQIDAGSPLGLLGKQAKITSELLIKNNWFQLIGSDAHDDKNRNFCLKDSLNYIDSIVDGDLTHIVNDNPQKILQGEDLLVDINYKIDTNKVGFFNHFKRILKE